MTLQFSLVAEVKQNLSELLAEWKSVQEELLSHSPSSSSAPSPPQNQLVPHLQQPAPRTHNNSQSSGGDMKQALGQDTLLVQRSDLEKLSTEAMMLKEFLPKVLNHDYVAMVGKLSNVEQGIPLL